MLIIDNKSVLLTNAIFKHVSSYIFYIIYLNILKRVLLVPMKSNGLGIHRPAANHFFIHKYFIGILKTTSSNFYP